MFSRITGRKEIVTGKDSKLEISTSIRMISDFIRTALGPRGACKLIVRDPESFTLTSRGKTIFSNLSSENFSFKILREAVIIQEREIGDGIKTTLILLGELLNKTEKLLGTVHSNLVIEGFKKATEEAIKILESMSFPVDEKDEKTLKNVALTALNSRSLIGIREYFAEMIVKAIKQVVEFRNGKRNVDVGRISIIAKEGGTFFESEYIKGVVLRTGIGMKYLYLYPDMPRKVRNARIALVSDRIESSLNTRFGAMFDSVVIRNDPAQLKKFVESEFNILNDAIAKVEKSGANVLFCKGSVDDIALHLLVQKGFLTVRNLEEKEMDKIVEATGGKLVGSVEELEKSCLGKAGLVEIKKLNGEEMLFIHECENPRSVTLLLRGPGNLDEAKNCVRNAVKAVAEALTSGKVVPGGGSVEVEIAEGLRRYARKLLGKEMLAIEAYASAIETIPCLLALSAGLNPIETISNLRKRHAEGWKNFGVEVVKGCLADMVKAGILEPLNIKRYILKLVKELVTMFLRVDVMMFSRMVESRKLSPHISEKVERIPIVVEKSEEKY